MKLSITTQKRDISKSTLFCFLILIFLMIIGCSSKDSTTVIDADQNGVRDDVDALIDSKPYTADQKTALRNYANKVEKLTAAANDDAINAAVDEIKTSLESYYSEFGANINPLNEVKDKELNTRELVTKYLQSMEKIKGRID